MDDVSRGHASPQRRSSGSAGLRLSATSVPPMAGTGSVQQLSGAGEHGNRPAALRIAADRRKVAVAQCTFRLGNGVRAALFPTRGPVPHIIAQNQIESRSSRYRRRRNDPLPPHLRRPDVCQHDRSALSVSRQLTPVNGRHRISLSVSTITAREPRDATVHASMPGGSACRWPDVASRTGGAEWWPLFKRRKRRGTVCAGAVGGCIVAETGVLSLQPQFQRRGLAE